MSSSSSSYVLEDAVNTIYKHLSSMLYNKVQVIKCIEEAGGTDVPNHIVDDNLYFENFHQIVQQLVPYAPNTRLLLLNEAFNLLHSNRAQFTDQINQLYYEHFNKKMRVYLQGKRKTIYKMRDYLYGTRERRKDRDTWSRNNNKCANNSDLELRFRYNVIVFNPNFIGRRFT